MYSESIEVVSVGVGDGEPRPAGAEGGERREAGEGGGRERGERKYCAARF